MECLQDWRICYYYSNTLDKVTPFLYRHIVITWLIFFFTKRRIKQIIIETVGCATFFFANSREERVSRSLRIAPTQIVSCNDCGLVFRRYRYRYGSVNDRRPLDFLFSHSRLPTDTVDSRLFSDSLILFALFNRCSVGELQEKSCDPERIVLHARTLHFAVLLALVIDIRWQSHLHRTYAQHRVALEEV